MSRYPDCTHPTGDCAVCSLSSYNRDCRNAPVGHLAYLRSCAGLTQQAAADAAGMNLRQLQKYESGEYDAANMTLKTALALSAALGIHPAVLVGITPPDNQNKMTEDLK